MSDNTSNDLADDDDYDIDGDTACGECGGYHYVTIDPWDDDFLELEDPDLPPWMVRLIPWVFTVLSAAAMLYLVLAGRASASQPWGLVAGVALFAFVVLRVSRPAGYLAVALVSVLLGFTTPAPFFDSCLTGVTLAALCLFGGWLSVIVVGRRPAVQNLVRRLQSVGDPIAEEADSGYADLDTYLTYTAAKLAPSTLAAKPVPGRRIIALSGYAGAGKDTAAAGLIYSRDYTRVSFADVIRAFALALDPITVITPDEPHYEKFVILEGRPATVRLSWVLEVLDNDWTLAKQVPEVRGLLQRLGTDAGRQVLGDNVWVNAVMGALPDGDLVFTDCRFPNEAAAVKAAGGHVVRVERPDVVPVNPHPSETALDDWEFDHMIINDKDRADCRAAMLTVEAELYPAANTAA